MEFDSPYFYYAGHSCLDFANTFDHRHNPPQYDFLSDRETLLKWGRKAGILSPNRPAKAAPAARSFKRAVQTRNLVFELFSPFTRSALPKANVVNAFSLRLQAFASKMALAPSPGGYRLVCTAEDPLEQIECAILQSASALLQSNQTDRIQECKGCGWLFFDSTRNHSRRWCTMAICGNRAKARRHYARIRRSG
jgi:predicted RNA-binding Zn ribbon-like protein